MRSNIDKGIALNRLSRLKGIPLTEIMAFGDNLNDLEMIREVGLGVAMKNAKSEILKASDLVTETDNNHDGVLNTLQTYYKKNSLDFSSNELFYCGFSIINNKIK